jgi:hypothetical protein
MQAAHCLKQRVCRLDSMRMAQFKAFSTTFNLFFLSHLNRPHILSISFLRLLFSPTLYTIYYLRLFSSSIFGINHGDKPTYSPSSYRNAALETSPWSRRLNHLHSCQRCPHWVRCRSHRLSPVSTGALFQYLVTHFHLPSSWRDRGKEPLPQALPASEMPQQPSPPPPPYQQGEWQPGAASVKVTPPTPVQASPRSPRKPRHLQVTSTSKRPIIYHRKSRSRVQISPPIPAIPSTPYFPAPQSEFNFGYNQEDPVEQTPLEDKVSLLFISLTNWIDFFCVFRWIG